MIALQGTADDDPTARAKAIEFFYVASEHHFKAVVTRLEKVRAKEPAKR